MALNDASNLEASCVSRRSRSYAKATPRVRLVKRGWKFLSYSTKENAHLPSSSVNSDELIDGSANSGDSGSNKGRLAAGELDSEASEECSHSPVMEDEHPVSEMSMPDGRPPIWVDLLPLPSYRQDVPRSPVEVFDVTAQSHVTLAVDRGAGKLPKLLINEEILDAGSVSQPGTTSSIQKGRFTLTKPKEHAILRTPSGRRKFTFEPSDSSTLTPLEARPTSACGYRESGVVSAEAHHGQDSPNSIPLFRSLSTPNPMSRTQPIRCHRRVHTVIVRSPTLATWAGILQVYPSFQSPSLGVSVAGFSLSSSVSRSAEHTMGAAGGYPIAEPCGSVDGREAMRESKSVQSQLNHQLLGQGQRFAEGGYQRRSICVTSPTRRLPEARTTSRFRRHTQPSSSKVDGEPEKKWGCPLGTGVMEEVVSSSATGRQFTVVRKGTPSPRVECGGRQLTAAGQAGNLPDVSLANGASVHMFLPTFQSSMSKPGLGCATTKELPQLYDAADSASGATDKGTDGAVSSIASDTASSISTVRTADSGYAASVHVPQSTSWASSPLEEGTSNAQMSTIAQQPTWDVRSAEGAARPTETTPMKKNLTSATTAGNTQPDAFPIGVSSVTDQSTVHGKTGRKFVITREEST